MIAKTLQWGAAALLVLSTHGAGASAFEDGAQAYEAGDYERALEHFDRARAGGNNKATLIYNRAVTLYKLGRLEAAKTDFSSLLLNNKWVNLARYNLGRIAEEQGDMRAAYRWYQRVRDNTEKPRLQHLAKQKMAQLQAYAPGADKPTAPPAGPDKGAALLSLGLVRDSNAASLADELTQRASNVADVYLRALVYGHYYIDGEKDDGLKLYGLAHARRYREFDSFNTSVAGVGVVQEMPLRSWQLDLGMRLTHIAVEAGTLADQFTLSANLEHPFASGIAQAVFESSFFSAGEDYAYLDGSQYRLDLAWRKSFGKIVIAPGVRWETNDREDRETKTNYYSYSPTLWGVMADVRWEVTDNWRLFGELNWTQATYGDENRLTDIGGIATEQQRENTRTEMLAGIRYRITPNWFVKAAYEYAQSDDNFDLYRYDKQVFSLKVDYVWD